MANRRDIFVVGITKGIHIIAIAIQFSSYGQNSYLGNTNKHVSMAQEITDAWRLEEIIIKLISQKHNPILLGTACPRIRMREKLLCSVAGWYLSCK
jgi:hypothetical protein